MKQKIEITNSNEVNIIQAGRDVHYNIYYEGKAKELLPKEQEARLKDGEERNFCFLAIDVVEHSTLFSKFNPTVIDQTLSALRHWLNPIITNKNGKGLDWASDGGVFYFLQEKSTDTACDNAVSASMEILEGLDKFNDAHNQLFFNKRRTDIMLREGEIKDGIIF